MLPRPVYPFYGNKNVDFGCFGAKKGLPNLGLIVEARSKRFSRDAMMQLTITSRVRDWYSRVGTSMICDNVELAVMNAANFRRLIRGFILLVLIGSIVYVYDDEHI